MAENPHLVAAREHIADIKATDVPQLREILACSPQAAAKKAQAADKENRKVYAYLASAASEDEIDEHLSIENDALRATILAARKNKLLLSAPVGPHAEIMAALDAFRVEHMQEFETEQDQIFRMLSGKKKSKKAEKDIKDFETKAINRAKEISLNDCSELENELKAKRSTTPDRRIADNNVCIFEYLNLASTPEEIRTHNDNRQTILQARVDKLLSGITEHKKKALREAIMQYQEFETTRPAAPFKGSFASASASASAAHKKNTIKRNVNIDIGRSSAATLSPPPPSPPSLPPSSLAPAAALTKDYIAQTYDYLSDKGPKDFFSDKNPTSLSAEYSDSYKNACKKSKVTPKDDILPAFTQHTGDTTSAVTYNNAAALLMLGDDLNLCLAGATHLVSEGIKLAVNQDASPQNVTFNLKLDPNIAIPNTRALENLLLSQITAFTVYGLKVNIVWADFEAKYKELKTDVILNAFEENFKTAMIDKKDERFTKILDILSKTDIHPHIPIRGCTRQKDCTAETLSAVINASEKSSFRM